MNIEYDLHRYRGKFQMDPKYGIVLVHTSLTNVFFFLSLSLSLSLSLNIQNL